MLAANPLDNDSRLKIADLLSQTGRPGGGRDGLPRGRDARRALGPPAARRSWPARCWRRWASKVDDIVASMAATYATARRRWPSSRPGRRPSTWTPRSRRSGRRARGDLAAIARRARARAPATCRCSSQYPEQFLPVPFLSELPREVFPAAMQSLRLIRAGDGEIVIRAG